jgi:hypothetical protein
LLVGGKMAARRQDKADDDTAKKGKRDKKTKNGKAAAGGKRGESGSAEGATVRRPRGRSSPPPLPRYVL